MRHGPYAGLHPDVAALVMARYDRDVQHLGRVSCIYFRDDIGLKVAFMYNHFVWPNIGIHVVAREGTLWCYPDILYHAFAYPMLQLDCRRVTAPVKSTNLASIKMVTALGFTLEGTLRRAGPEGEDTLLYGMLREECRWLQRKKEKAA